MKTALCLATILSLTVLTGCYLVEATADARPEATITLAGITIAQADPQSEYGGSLVPGLQPGTTIHLIVSVPGRNVIKIHESEEGEFSIQDSTGKSLTPSGNGIGFMSDIAEGGQSFRLPVASKDLPARQATGIKVNGHVKLTCGSDLQTDELAPEIREGTKLELAGISFMVTEVKESYMNKEDEMFAISSSISPARIQRIEATLNNGDVVELRPCGSSRFGINGEVTYSRHYSVPGKAADISGLKVTYFRNVDELEVPINLVTGLGFQTTPTSDARRDDRD